MWKELLWISNMLVITTKMGCLLFLKCCLLRFPMGIRNNLSQTIRFWNKIILLINAYIYLHLKKLSLNVKILKRLKNLEFYMKISRPIMLLLEVMRLTSNLVWKKKKKILYIKNLKYFSKKLISISV